MITIIVVASLMARTIKKTINFEKNSARQEKFSVLGELSSRIVHDLRNPLTIIKTTNDLLRIHNSDPDEKTIRLLDAQDKAFSQMTSRIDEILDFVRIDKTKTKKTNITDSMKYLLGSLPIPEQVSIKSDLEDIMIDCNPEQIETVFANLIQNAIQAMNLKGKLTVNINSKDKLAQIQISDTGEGIPEGKLEEIFTPLYTTKKTGTGLGLTSCKSIVESHGGKIFA
ncbi:MAG: HAMP domain-containing histidine kinase, partial [Nitrosopumilus sp.]|nr:HAMP domain-containing histidine kinase [Nitrosopumilus sp.]